MGARCTTNRVYPNCEVVLQEEKLQADLIVLPIVGFDVIGLVVPPSCPG